MTQVLFHWATAGYVVVSRTRPDVAGGVTDPGGPTVYRIPADTPTVIDVAPTDPGEAVRLRCYPDGAPCWTWHVLIPAPGAGPVPLAELPRVDPATLQAEPPDQKAWAAELADIRTALAALPATSAPAVSHIAVTAEGRLVHRGGGTTTLTTTTSGRLAVVRA